MKTVFVKTENPYEIHIEHGLLDRCGQMIAQERAKRLLEKDAAMGEFISPGRACVITDKAVEALYLEETRVSLRGGGFQPCSFVVEGGESSKTLQAAGNIVDFLSEMNFGKEDLVIALGGGVVCDLAGFAASMYLGGIDFVEIPTNVLAASDCSVMDRAAVNAEGGKNIVSMPCSPMEVLIDPGLFDTLPSAVYSQGLSECIKIGIIADKFIFESFELGAVDIEEVIAKTAAMKGRLLLSEDTAILLELGHTIGRAVEKASTYEISHGDAVAIGIYTVAKASGAKKLCERILRCFNLNGLPWGCDLPKEEILAQLALDGKRKGGSIRLVVPMRIGECEVREMSLQQARDFLAEGLS